MAMCNRSDVAAVRLLHLQKLVQLLQSMSQCPPSAPLLGRKRRRSFKHLPFRRRSQRALSKFW